MIQETLRIHRLGEVEEFEKRRYSKTSILIYRGYSKVIDRGIKDGAGIDVELG